MQFVPFIDHISLNQALHIGPSHIVSYFKSMDFVVEGNKQNVRWSVPYLQQSIYTLSKTAHRASFNVFNINTFDQKRLDL